jgi:hypothetical protein
VTNVPAFLRPPQIEKFVSAGSPKPAREGACAPQKNKAPHFDKEMAVSRLSIPEYIRHSDFVIPSSFDIRASSFSTKTCTHTGPWHLANSRQTFPSPEEIRIDRESTLIPEPRFRLFTYTFIQYPKSGRRQGIKLQNAALEGPKPDLVRRRRPITF